MQTTAIPYDLHETVARLVNHGNQTLAEVQDWLAAAGINVSLMAISRVAAKYRCTGSLRGRFLNIDRTPKKAPRGGIERRKIVLKNGVKPRASRSGRGGK
jgi:hypothetical protein